MPVSERRSGAASPATLREEIRIHLQARRSEIEQAVLARVYGLADPTDVGDPQYIDGLRCAIAAAVDYGLSVIDGREAASLPIPDVLLSQARLAARNDIGLDIVLRRYFGGHALVCDYLVEAAEHAHVAGEELQGLLRAQAFHFDRLLVAIGEEHTRETARPRNASSESLRAERVRRLLAGELVDLSGIAYDFDGCHIGVVAVGGGAGKALQELARTADRELLSVRCDDDTVWGWLGGRTAVDVGQLVQQAPTGSSASLAMGEPGEGFAGWRLTHLQARATLPIALRSAERTVRYRDVAVLTAVLRDDLLATSLQQIYLAPLANERDGGEVARQTLRAYFATGRNASSAASALGVNRRTVTNRLRTLEHRIGRALDECALDFEMALRLDELA